MICKGWQEYTIEAGIDYVTVALIKGIPNWVKATQGACRGRSAAYK